MGVANNVNLLPRLHKLVQIPVIPVTDKVQPNVSNNNKKPRLLKVNLVEEKEKARSLNR
jgi:hypothetical protein